MSALEHGGSDEGPNIGTHAVYRVVRRITLSLGGSPGGLWLQVLAATPVAARARWQKHDLIVLSDPLDPRQSSTRTMTMICAFKKTFRVSGAHKQVCPQATARPSPRVVRRISGLPGVEPRRACGSVRRRSRSSPYLGCSALLR